MFLVALKYLYGDDILFMSVIWPQGWRMHQFHVCRFLVGILCVATYSLQHTLVFVSVMRLSNILIFSILVTLSAHVAPLTSLLKGTI